MEAIKARGINIVIGSLADSLDDLVTVLRGYDTIINAISAATPQQLVLALTDAVAQAKPKRYVPCSFATICPPGGVMALRDDKEEIFHRVWYHKIPYTIIDVGFWHQISVPKIPSGKFDQFIARPENTIIAEGDVKSMLSDKRDIGRWVARIIRDDRTLNKKVFACSDVLSQNELIRVVEEKSGEKVELTHVSKEQFMQGLKEARAAASQAKDTSGYKSFLARASFEYSLNKAIRGDNTPEVGEYLGYLDARELYPDFKPLKYVNFIEELLEGKGKKPYADASWTQ